MKRSPVKPYGKKYKPIPKSVLKEICERDGGTWDERAIPPGACVYCGRVPDWRGFCFAHREPKGMGGRFGAEWERINADPENQCYIPWICHDFIDCRIGTKEQSEQERIKHSCKEKGK